MIFNYCADFLFLIDVIIIFNTAFYNDNMQLKDDRATLAKRYITSWFFVDILAIIPFDLIY
jgi:hypothetical protein